MSFRKWKFVGALCLVFAAGMVVGALATGIAVKRAFARSLRFETWTDRTSSMLKKRLELTEAQDQKVHAIVVEMGGQLKSTFGKAIAESGVSFVEYERRIDAELTPEQKIRHEKLKHDFRAAMKKINLDLPGP